jgi:hypothetical protein
MSNIVTEYDYEFRHLSWTEDKYTINLLKRTNMTNIIKVKRPACNVN